MNRDLFWKLLQPEHERAEAFCRRLSGNREDGDDLYQESLLAAMRSFRRLRNRKAFRGWLYRIIMNRYKNRLRRPSNRSMSLSDDLAEKHRVIDPSAGLAARRWLERAFRALSPEDQALVTMFELEGWPISEIAEVLGRPEGTIKARLSRAREKMRRTIAEYLKVDEKNRLTNEAGYALPRSETSTD